MDLVEGGGTKLDLYLLYLDKETAVFAPGAAEEERTAATSSTEADST